jgi:hypothetical protein
VQRVGHFLHFEPFALIGNADREAGQGFGLGFFDHDTDMDLLITVVTITVYDGVDHAFANGHTNPMLIVLVETSLTGGFQDLTLGEIDALQGGWIVVIVQCVRAWMQFHFSLAACKKRGISARERKYETLP